MNHRRHPGEGRDPAQELMFCCAEHSLLSQKYSGHRALIDWARNFIENSVLPALTKKNNDNLEGSTAYFWIHRDAPAYVHQAMGILKYTGIVQEHMAGVKMALVK